jgi:hypothetical protein
MGVVYDGVEYVQEKWQSLINKLQAPLMVIPIHLPEAVVSGLLLAAGAVFFAT